MTVRRLYLWKAPRDLDVPAAEALIRGWHDAGGDPRASPFDPSTDLGWFHRELTESVPGLDVTSDAVPSGSRTPIWMSGTDEAPARIVAIRLGDDVPPVLDDIVGLAAKYDLVLYDARSGQIQRPLEDLAAYASATFWPTGAIRTLVAGAVGAALAGVAWFLAIPLLSGVLVVVGGFLVLLTILTFVHEARARLGSRRGAAQPPPDQGS